MADFDKALRYVLLNEGVGFTDRAADRGGPTKYGISQATLQKHRGKLVVSPADVQALTMDEAEVIYRGRYWGPIGGQVITHQGKATAIFDAGVLCGPYSATMMAQGALRLRPNGKMTASTLSAVNLSGVSDFLSRFVALYLAHFVDIVRHDPVQLANLKGWTNRAARLVTVA